jgi:hypothetical protein
LATLVCTISPIDAIDKFVSQRRIGWIICVPPKKHAILSKNSIDFFKVTWLPHNSLEAVIRRIMRRYWDHVGVFLVGFCGFSFIANCVRRFHQT